MRISRSFPLTFCQKCLLKLAMISITLCSFAAPQSRATKTQILQRLEGFFSHGH